MVGVFLPGSLQKNQDVLTSAIFNSIHEFSNTEVKVIDFYSGNKLEKLLDDDIEVVKFDLNNLCDNLRNWSDVLEECKKFLVEQKFDTVVCYKMMMRANARFGDEKKIQRQVKNLADEPERGFDFQMTKKYSSFLTFIEACSEVCENFYQYVSDPMEPVLGKVFKFKNFKDLYYNAAKRRGSIVMPFYEYKLLEGMYTKLGKQEVPFTFYCSAVTDDRKYIADMQYEFESIECWDVNIGTKDKEHKRRMTTQREYMSMLSNSKCSLVIKPYDHQAFSWTRFVECLYSNCLPLVWDECKFQDIDGIFKEASKLTKEKLLVGSIDELKKKVSFFDENEDERQKTIKKLRVLIESTGIVGIQWLKDRWQKLEGFK